MHRPPQPAWLPRVPPLLRRDRDARGDRAQGHATEPREGRGPRPSDGRRDRGRDVRLPALVPRRQQGASLPAGARRVPDGPPHDPRVCRGALAPPEGPAARPSDARRHLPEAPREARAPDVRGPPLRRRHARHPGASPGRDDRPQRQGLEGEDGPRRDRRVLPGALPGRPARRARHRRPVRRPRVAAKGDARSRPVHRGRTRRPVCVLPPEGRPLLPVRGAPLPQRAPPGRGDRAPPGRARPTAGQAHRAALADQGRRQRAEDAAEPANDPPPSRAARGAPRHAGAAPPDTRHVRLHEPRRPAARRRPVRREALAPGAPGDRHPAAEVLRNAAHLHLAGAHPGREPQVARRLLRDVRRHDRAPLRPLDARRHGATGAPHRRRPDPCGGRLAGGWRPRNPEP
jgi:hypothetical protein